MDIISSKYTLNLTPHEVLKAFKEADWDYSQVRNAAARCSTQPHWSRRQGGLALCKLQLPPRRACGRGAFATACVVLCARNVTHA